jgi:hypothetical protein
MKKKIIRSAIFGVLALQLSAVTLVVFQVCFVESFWLHAMVFPMNPQTLSQPTAFTYVGDVCQILFSVFLLLGMLLLLRSARLFFLMRRNHAA